MKKLVKVLMFALVIVLGVTALTACKGNNGDDFDPAKNITIVVRENGSGTKTAFMELIGLKGKDDPMDIVRQTGTAAILATVKTNTYAIAYESLGYCTDDVKKLTVDGKEATVANIKSGDYKISRPLSVVYKAATITSGINKKFYEFLQSSEAQAIINEEGYVSLNAGSAYVKDASLTTGTINVSGSTSLEPLMKELVKKFIALQPGITVNVTAGGSGAGYTNARTDVHPFGMISEEFSDAADKGAGCAHLVVCKDGIAVIVNKANTTNNITMAQLKNIYNAEEPAATKIVKWSDIK